MAEPPQRKRVARSDFWRGDLLRAWQQFEHSRREFEAFARDRGFDRRAVSAPLLDRDSLSLPAEAPEPIESDEATEPTHADPNELSVWVPTRYLRLPQSDDTNRSSEGQDSEDSDEEPVRICDASVGPLPQSYLASWPELRNRLEPLLGFPSKTKRIDTDALVRQFSRGRAIRRIPYQEQKRAHDRIVLIRDQSLRCVPYRADQIQVSNQLQSISVRNGLRVLDGAFPSELMDPNHLIDGYRNRSVRGGRKGRLNEPEPGSHVLILGDLGWLDESGSAFEHDAMDAWKHACRRWVLRGCHVFALVPYRPERLPMAMSRWVRAIAWQGNTVEEIPCEQRDAAMEQLLTLAYPAQRIEPGLLRAIRQLCPGLKDASLESTFWQDRRHSGARLDAIKNDRAELRKRLEPGFEALDPVEITKVLRSIRAFRIANGFSILWQTELLNLAPWIRELIDPDGDDQSMATRTVKALLHQMEHGGRSGLQDRLTTISLQATDYAMRDPRVGEAVRRMKAWSLPDVERHHSTRLTEVQPDGRLGETIIRISGDLDRLRFHPPVSRENERDSAWANTEVMLPARKPLIELHVPEDAVQPDRERVFWKSGSKPQWVSDYGTDQYGAWCEFQVPRHEGEGVVTQRLRWIPPGEFMMGSPESEEGRWDDEGPQHMVKLTQGYWLADTQVTQELWIAVDRNENPIGFTGTLLPVERVSWDDCQTWLSKLNQENGSLQAVLPTEAQWEYACRAGTQTAYCFGDDPKDLPKYAWFQENSKNQIHAVKELLPNGWGLYDMHGNVWELCSDWYGDYKSADTIDPTGPESGANRVCRGGGAWDVPGLCRSASRHYDSPGLRVGDLGFRLALGSVPGAEPSEGAITPAAEPGVERGSMGSELAAPRPVRRDSFWKSGIAPEWVSDFGKDTYGLWCEFQVPRYKGDGMVTQRLRWIPPGQFMMGSPENEAGRFVDEGPQHLVTLTKGYWLADSPVTQELWIAIDHNMAIDCGIDPSEFYGSSQAVEGVSWEDCKEWLSTLSQRVGVSMFTLPTEAQWEYACRAGSTTAYCFGNDPRELPKYARFEGNSENQTQAVKELLPNGWGLYDMHGRIWEWCSDWHGPYASTQATDPTGPSKGWSRVARGGRWIVNASLVRSACRLEIAPNSRNEVFGFRLALSSVHGAEPSEGAITPAAEPGVERGCQLLAQREYVFVRSLDLDDRSSRALEAGFAELDFESLDSVRVISDTAGYQFDRLCRPAWAVDFGCDAYGLYATFEVQPIAPPSSKSSRSRKSSRQPAEHSTAVRQRLRWIPPGRFQMGSSESEPGRRAGELQHWVNITHGYWMFDTPCTQALWECVMGSNRSLFQDDPNCPVESVSWEDVSEFVTQFLTQFPLGLRLRLPTEAEWEYACRAGTTTATYAGEAEPVRSVYPHRLDKIAWYRSNSGVEIDFREDPDLWLNDQYQGKHGGTFAVGKKNPNAWGLFDMLGNVWEWCWDVHHDYTPLEQIDPVGVGKGVKRAARGGGWDSSARFIRSACRNAFDASRRSERLGFRLVSSAFEPG